MKLDELKPGYMIFHNDNTKLEFCYFSEGKIQSSYSTPRFVLEPKAPAMFLEKFKYTSLTSAPMLTPTAVAMMARASVGGTAAKDWNGAVGQWLTTKKIPGGIFLANGGKKIWISHYDLKYFEEACLP